ncbi:ATP-binding protein [Nostocoides australiense]
MSSGNRPLQFLGVHDLLDREYRNSPAYQWGRELARNGIEADATTIRFGVEWCGVEATGTYRMQYSDDGHGMSKDELRNYMSTLGRGGKVVGGAHDNYALGSRMTLLPWNPYGVVVISVVNGDPWMVKMLFDQDANSGEGEYVLEEIEWEDEDGSGDRATVYPPYEDTDLGFNWGDTLPEFIRKAGHGTTFILLGRNAGDDTFDGDPERNERHRYLGRKYFNARFWELPDGVTLQVQEMPDKRADWPKSRSESGKYQNRTVRGGRSLVEYTKSAGDSCIADSGVVSLRDHTKVHWWLRTEPTVETGGLGAKSGFVAVLYRGELYGQASADQEDGDVRVGAAVYRQFGIGSDAVRRKVFLVIEPPEYNETTGGEGVAPSTGRADLYWMGAGKSPRSVKPSDWAEEFGEKLPKAILDAINAEFESRDQDEDREQRLQRVLDRFSKRWKAPRARVESVEPDTETTLATPGTTPRTPIDSPSPRPRKASGPKKVVVPRRGDGQTLGQPGQGDTPAKTTRVAVGIPDCKWVTEADIAEAGMMAAWQPPSALHPNGCIEIASDHQVIRNQVEFHQNHYPPAVAKDIEKIVRDVYEEIAIAKVSHIHALGTLFAEEKREEMLQNPSLTTSLLGLIAEDAVIGPRTGKLGTKRRRHEESVLEDVNESAPPATAS